MATSDAIGQQSPPDQRQQAAPAAPIMANPGPWAVTAFATTSFMLGMYQSGLLSNASLAIVLPAAFFFGGMVQVIVAVMEFSRGNMFGGAVFGTYGPFWIILGAFNTIYATGVPAANLATANSLLEAVFAVVTFYLAIASLRTDMVLAVIFWLIFAGLILLSVGTAEGIGNVVKAGGWVVLAFAVLAWYHAAGDIIESTFGRKLLPFGPPPVR